jgi:lysophospholipase L1-like esterase
MLYGASTTIACLGASTVQGVGDPGGGGFVGRLRSWLEVVRPGSAVYNLGVGGQTTRDFCRRFAAEINERGPDTVLFQLGTNDVPRRGEDPNGTVRVRLEAFRANVAWLFAAAKPRRTLLMTTVTPDPTRSGIDLEVFQRYLEASQAEATTANVEVIDAWAVTGRRPPQELLDEDGVHLRPRGHQLLADLVRRHLGG